MKTTKIYGSPGTGKTTYLITMISKLISSGVTPSSICLLAFTKKAAKEAKYRLLNNSKNSYKLPINFNISPDDLKGFRTIHSLAFSAVSKQKYSLLGNSDLATIARSLGIPFTFKFAEDDSMLELKKGDKFQAIENNSRIKTITLKEAFYDFNDVSLRIEEFLDFVKFYRTYKKENNKVDFTDMLTIFLEEGSFYQYDYVIVDECQDLSLLQWRVIEKISKNAKELVVVGDDDQSIFSWSGADTDYFLDMKGKEIVLGQSYRVPKRVYREAQNIISRVSKRKDKEWRTTDRKGSVRFIASEYDLNIKKGEWLLLVRNKSFCDIFISFCSYKGVFYHTDTDSLVSEKLFNALYCWNLLKKGDVISKESALNLYSFLGSGKGYREGSKKKLKLLQEDAVVDISELHKHFGLINPYQSWQNCFNISDNIKSYLVSCFENGEKLSKKHRIRISTIHSAKGAEAENVAIITDMSRKSFQAYLENNENEHKVWYVAATRAKEKLFIISPKTRMYYDW